MRGSASEARRDPCLGGGAAGVNPIDVAIRCGGHYGVALPLIPGFDGAGRVEEAGTKSAASARETASIFPCGRKRARMPAEW
ncbi:protein of unknown function [Methylacidimicrobium sp. AP8]|nr:protein of unknown function [Methylacidimicrobium sp. AP8]